MKLSCRTVPSLVALLAALVPWGLLCPVGCTGPRAAERAADRRPESSVRRAPSGGVETPFDEKDSAGSRPEHSAPAHSPAPPAAGPAEPGTTIAGGDEESKASDRSGGKPAPGTGYDFAGSFVEGETIRPAAPAPPPSAAPLSREETAKKEHAPAKAPPASPPARRSPAPASPRVQAGYADDNKQFNHFLDYLRGASSLDHLPLDVSNRIRITLLDERGKSVPNCLLSLRDPGGKLLQERRSYADGRVLLFPSEEAALQVQGLKLSARCLEQTQELVLDPHGLREHQLRYPAARPSWERVPLDVAFLIDTTGSMGDEIARLKATLEVIHFQITHMSSSPEVRFGMVLYRDQGDDYRTRVVPFTGDVEAFQRELAKVEAGGGGDGPEDLQEGLARAFGDLRWNEQGVRLLFLLADAQPHLDYGQQFTYREAMREAARRAIKMVTIGASGLPPEGEIVFRQLAQYTQGLFIFLTYGEKGESDGGTSASVSHHTGANWQAQDLDGIVVGMVKRELSHLTDRPVDDGEEYYEASTDKGAADRDAMLAELFDKGTGQLLKFSTLAIAERTPTTVLPVAIGTATLKQEAEQVEDRILLALARAPSFQVVERRDAQKLVEELRKSGSDLFDSEKSASVGKMLGAKLALISKLTAKEERLELFLKLVRVETGEVLSIAMLKLDPKLLR